jgi:hypothetical protein
MLHLFYVLLWCLPFVLQSEIDVMPAVSTAWAKLYYMNSRESGGAGVVGNEVARAGVGRSNARRGRWTANKSSERKVQRAAANGGGERDAVNGSSQREAANEKLCTIDRERDGQTSLRTGRPPRLQPTARRRRHRR